MNPDRKHAVWEIETDDIGADLTVVESPDTPGRYHLTPTREMSLAAYQDALAETQGLWQQV